MNTCSAAKTKNRQHAFHLTQKVDYGLFLLARLAQKGSASIATIAKESSLSFSFLQKVANLLKNAEIIKAIRGKDGGYLLVKDPASITVKHVVEALEGPIAIVGCVGQKKQDAHACPRVKFCAIRSTFSRMNTEISEYYLSKKLTDFLS